MVETLASSVAAAALIAAQSVSPSGVYTDVEMVMVGDMLMHTGVVDSGLQADGTYNYDHLFAHVDDRISQADIALVNQETILGGKSLGFSGYPAFNSPTELGDAEVKAGFDVILHGTNHALDKGMKGVDNCTEFWEENYPDIAYIGINSTQEHQDEIYVTEKKGIKIAILNYTYGTNGIDPPEDKPYAIDYFDEDLMRKEIEKAHELADFVVVCPHWGTEFNLGTDSFQQKWTKFFLDEGVDLVIGTHPHVIEPVEWVSDDAGNKMLVYYSLGNFVNNTSSMGEGVMNRQIGGMADVTITRDESGDVSIKDYEAIPLVCHWGEDGSFTTYYLDDYTQEMAESNQVVTHDPDFTLEACQELVDNVWGSQE